MWLRMSAVTLNKLIIILLSCALVNLAQSQEVWFDASLGTTGFDGPDNLGIEQPFFATELTGYVNTRTDVSEATELEARLGIVGQVWLPEWPASARAVDNQAERYRYDVLSGLQWQSGDQRAQLQFDVDRLKAVGYWSDNTVQLGRQAVSLGIARVFPVIDVIQPNANVLGQSSYRPGVDAVRLTHFFDALTEADLILVGGDGLTAVARARTFMRGVDLEATVINFDGQQNILAASINGGVAAYGLWFESALYQNESATDWRWTAGIDSTLGDVYWLSEFHYNGIAGSNNANSVFYDLSAVNARGNYYWSMQTRYGLTLISSLSAGAQYQLDSGEWLLNAAFNTELNQTTAVQASFVVPISDASAELAEYGLMPSVFFIKADWTF